MMGGWGALQDNPLRIFQTGERYGRKCGAGIGTAPAEKGSGSSPGWPTWGSKGE